MKRSLETITLVMVLMLTPALALAATDPGLTFLQKLATMLTGPWGAALYFILLMVSVVSARFGKMTWGSALGGWFVIVLCAYGGSSYITWASALA